MTRYAYIAGPVTGHADRNRPAFEAARLVVERITGARALDADTAVIVDVRAAEAYAGGRIAGAINIPLGELEARLGELDPNQWIITFCT